MTVKCPTCGMELQEGQQCPHCKPKSDSTIDRFVHKSGELIEKGVEVTEKAVGELKPAAKEIANTGKKGLSKLKKATLSVAKDLKKD